MEKRIGIVGGGPSGLSCAIELASRGFLVDVYEKKSWPVYKVCGEGIMPSGYQILKDLGVIKYLDKKDLREFEGIEYHQFGYLEAGAKFENNKKGVAISRSKLSEALFLRCQDFKNINLKSNTKIEDIHQLDHDHIILCEGIRGRIKSKLKCSSPINQNRKRIGAHAYFDFAWENKMVELHWGHHIEAYITPIAADKTQLTILWDDTKLKLRGQDFYFKALSTFFPHLSQFSKARMRDKVYSYGPFDTKSSCIQKDRFIFAGDDLYFLDGITGEGLSLAFKQAKLLGEHIQSKNNYKNKVFDYISLYELLTRASLLISGSVFFRRFSLNLFQGFDSLFAYFLKLNDGAEKLSRKERFILKLLSYFINKDYRPIL
ncbi:MAG: NAD(P)/FAD-dependent oxidoreductase [Bacteriovoracaceae bacterium]